MRFLLFFSALLMHSVWMNAQISLQPQDLPNVGDTLHYSVAQLPVVVRPGESGENKSWDFTQLNSNTQFADRFSAVSGTNLVYTLFFGLPGNNFSNLAKTENNAPTLPSQTGIQFSDAYNFYRNTPGSLVQKGFGSSLNGIPIPVPYSSPETVYVFPLNYGHRDTSDYSYEVSLPGFGYYGRTARRINHVDAWGTITTIFGTFEALRIRSELQASDTLALDTIGQGFRIPLPDEVKYKWVAKNHGWPLLEITATDLFGLEVSNRVVYRDFKKIDTGFEQLESANLSTRIYPNPASDYLIAETELVRVEDLRYELLAADGRLINGFNRSNVPPGKATEIISLHSLQLANGLYFLRISTASGANSIRPCIVDNP